MQALQTVLQWLLDCISHSICVEFDYTDGTHERHGRCNIKTLWLSEERLENHLHNWGYRNVHIVK